MLIYGGLTKRGTDDSLWSFNVTTLRWNKVTGTFQFCKNTAVVIAFGAFSSARSETSREFQRTDLCVNKYLPKMALVLFAM